MINQLAPLPNIGGVIVMSGASSAHPDVTNNARFIRYIWLDTQTAGSILLKIYQGTYPSDTYADWSTVAIADGSITAAKLANYAVSVLNGSGASKIAYRQDAAADATKAGYILRVDASGQYVEVASLATLMANFPLNPALISGGTADLQVLTYSASLAHPIWQAINLATAITDGSLTLAKLVVGTNYYLLRNGAAGIPEQVSNSDILAPNGLFPDNSIKTQRLYYLGAADRDTIRFNGVNWIKQTPFYGSLGSTIPIANGSKTVAHGLGYTPRKFGAVLVCNTNDAATGWQAGDVLDIQDAISPLAGPSPAFQVWANATLVGVSYTLHAGVIGLVTKAGANQVAPTNVANFDLFAWAEI
jgi:hypothetical protein